MRQTHSVASIFLVPQDSGAYSRDVFRVVPFLSLMLFLLAYSKFDGALQELHVQFDEWFSAQMNRLCGLALS